MFLMLINLNSPFFRFFGADIIVVCFYNIIASVIKKKAPVAFVMCNGRLLLYAYDLEWCRLIFLSSCHYLTIIFFTLSPFFTM